VRRYTFTPPGHGTVTQDDPADPLVTYQSATGYFGSDSFMFTVSDGLDSATAKVAITVTHNHAPVARAASVRAPFEGSAPITLVDSDPDPDHPSYHHSTPHRGELTGSGAKLTYHADQGYAGADSFSFYISDDGVNSNQATITITVTKATSAIRSVAFNPARPTSGQVTSAVVRVSSIGSANRGTVTLRDGTTKYAARVSGTKATVKLGRLTSGTHRFTVAYAGTATTGGASTTVALKVTKVVSRLHVSTKPTQLATTS
jgi:hypothetical protein